MAFFIQGGHKLVWLGNLNFHKGKAPIQNSPLKLKPSALVSQLQSKHRRRGPTVKSFTKRCVAFCGIARNGFPHCTLRVEARRCISGPQALEGPQVDGSGQVRDEHTEWREGDLIQLAVPKIVPLVVEGKLKGGQLL